MHIASFAVLFHYLYGTYAKVTINNLIHPGPNLQGGVGGKWPRPPPPAQEAPLSRKIVLENLWKIGNLNKGEVWVTEHLLSHHNSTEGFEQGPRTQRHLGSREGIPHLFFDTKQVSYQNSLKHII